MVGKQRQAFMLNLIILLASRKHVEMLLANPPPLPLPVLHEMTSSPIHAVTDRVSLEELVECAWMLVLLWLWVWVCECVSEYECEWKYERVVWLWAWTWASLSVLVSASVTVLVYLDRFEYHGHSDVDGSLFTPQVSRRDHLLRATTFPSSQLHATQRPSRTWWHDGDDMSERCWYVDCNWTTNSVTYAW